MSFFEFQSIAEPAAAAPLQPKGKPGEAPPAPKAGKADGSKATQNLLVHIPGEASGFYLLGIEAIAGQGGVPPTEAAVVGAMALVLLVLVRWLAGASKAVMATSFLAFVIWMAVFDNGFLTLNGYAVPGKLGVVVAGFYSAVITALGTYGKLK